MVARCADPSAMEHSRIPFAPQGAVLTDIYEESAQFPTTLATKEGLRLFYQSYAHRHDTVKTGVYGEKGLEQVEVISGSGEALYPTALAVDGAEWCAWGYVWGTGASGP